MTQVNIALFAFDWLVQIIGMTLLIQKWRTKSNQKTILISLSCHHLGFATVGIYVLAVQLNGSEESTYQVMLVTFLRGTLGIVYPILMHYITLDRLLEVYLHMRYPVLFTKRIINIITITIWLTSVSFGSCHAILMHYYSLYSRLPSYFFPALSCSVLITVTVTYTYLYVKWKDFKQASHPKMTKNRSVRTHQFLLPFLIVLTFIVFEFLGSFVSVLRITLKLSTFEKARMRSMELSLFALGAISDVVIYVLLQRTIRRFLRKKIRTISSVILRKAISKEKLDSCSCSTNRSRNTSFVSFSKHRNYETRNSTETIAKAEYKNGLFETRQRMSTPL